MFIKNQLKKLVEEGQELLARSIKALIYKAREDTFDKLDYENNLACLEPFVFSYFHNGNNPSLDELLFGYHGKDNHLEVHKVGLSSESVFLPEIGTINLPFKDKSQLVLDYDGFKKFSYEGNPLEIDAIQYIGDSEIELFTIDHPHFRKYFFEWDDNINGFSSDHANYRIVSNDHFQNLEAAIHLLKASSPEYFQLVEDTNKRIVLFDNLRIRNFAVREMHGMAFIGASEEFSEIYYLEEVIHQCGHNIFNAATANLKEFFKIDPETHLGIYSKNQNEFRSIYSTLHGLFTIAARIECFQNALKLELNEFQHHELLGRLADLKRRFRTGLEFVDVDEVYTKKGQELYRYIDDYCVKEFVKIDSLVECFDYSNQTGPDFNYNEFLEVNDLNRIPAFM